MPLRSVRQRLAQVLRLSDDEAFATFKAIRWADNDGQPYCPKCGCTAVHSYTARRNFKCKGCEAQFSITSGTIFASRKLALRDILGAIAIFVNGAKGHSALQLSRDLDVQYKTAFVLSHKICEVMAAEVQGEEISGHVEIDGAYFGGYIKPANNKEHRLDRRLRHIQNGKRRVVVIMRERNGTTLPLVHKTATIVQNPGSNTGWKPKLQDFIRDEKRCPRREFGQKLLKAISDGGRSFRKFTPGPPKYNRTLGVLAT